MSRKYVHLLSPVKVGQHVLKNRMMTTPSGMHLNRGSEPFPTETLFAYYEGKARNGAAISVVNGANMYFKEQGDVFAYDYDIGSMHNRMPIAELVNGIHLYGGLATVNLHFRLPYGYDISGGLPIDHIGPPPIGADPYLRATIEAPIELLDEVAEKFSDNILMLKNDCGYDGVHVYMPYRALTLGRALSPLTNKRKDKYGGSLERQLAYPRHVMELIRKKCGPDFIIEASISFCDPFEEKDGLTIEDCAEYIKMCEGLVDFFTLKSPYKDPSHPIQFHEVTPWLDMSSKVRELSGRKVPIATVGGFTHPDIAEAALAEDKVDIIGMGRSWISNPQFMKLMLEDRPDDITPCLRCNKCHRSSWADPLIPVCSVNPTYGIEHKLHRIVKTPEQVRNTAVVGGGPAGMRTAMMLSDRGHKVTLYEAEDRLGGQLQVTKDVDFKWTLQAYKDWLIQQVGKRDIQVKLNTKATSQMLEAGGYDEILICVGAEPAIPPIPGVDGKNVMTAVDAYSRYNELGKRVIIIGGGEIGVETGIFLAKQGRDVTVVEMRRQLAMDSTPIHYWEMLKDELDKYDNLHGLTNATVVGLKDGKVVYRDKEGLEHGIPCDSVIVSAGSKPKRDEALSLFVPGVSCHMIGDCQAAGNIQKLNRTAFGITSAI